MRISTLIPKSEDRRLLVQQGGQGVSSLVDWWVKGLLVSASTAQIIVIRIFISDLD